MSVNNRIELGTLYAYASNTTLSTDEPNEVSVYVSYKKPENGEEGYLLDGFIGINVNNRRILTYIPSYRVQPNLGDLKYISFVATNDGEEDEFFYKTDE